MTECSIPRSLLLEIWIRSSRRRLGIWFYNAQSRCYTFLPFYYGFGLAIWLVVQHVHILSTGLLSVPRGTGNPQTGSSGGNTYPSGNGGSGGGHTLSFGWWRRRRSPSNTAANSDDSSERWIWYWSRADTGYGNGPADAAKEHRAIATKPVRPQKKLATKRHKKHKDQRRLLCAFCVCRMTQFI